MKKAFGLSAFLFFALSCAGRPSLPTKPVSAMGSSNASTLPEAASGVRLMVFDVFGTVVDWRSGIIEAGEALGKKYALKVDWAAFADQWIDRYQPSMEKVRSGEIPWTKMNVLFRRSLDQTLAANKIQGLSEEDKEHFSRVWYRLKPWPDSIGGLRRLKTRFIIAPLSNGNLSMLTEMAKRSGLPWDCILSAELASRLGL